ncbi:MAG: hypothetical protein QM604_00525 [Microbacterium sp.]
MSAAYRFRTVWRLPADPRRCWAELLRVLEPADTAAPWRGVRIASEHVKAAGPEAGDRVTMWVRSPLGFGLRADLVLTEVTPGVRLCARSAGDLRGAGRVELYRSGRGTAAVVRWEVSPQKPWMRRLPQLTRPAFVAAHALVMRRGRRALRRRLTRAG